MQQEVSQFHVSTFYTNHNNLSLKSHIHWNSVNLFIVAQGRLKEGHTAGLCLNKIKTVDNILINKTLETWMRHIKTC